MPHNSQTKKDKHTNQAKEIERLEAKVKRLQLALAAKDAVLSQFADSENWQEIDISGLGDVSIWRGDNPLDLANQALGEGK